MLRSSFRQQKLGQILNEMDIIQLAELEAKQIQQQAQQECRSCRRSRQAEIEQMRRQAQQELQEMQLHAIAEFEAIQKEPMNTPMTSTKWSSNSAVCELSATGGNNCN